MEKENYWQVYFDAATVARSEALRQEFFVETSGVRMHVDAYLRPDPSAPMVLLMRYALSSFSTSPTVPFEENEMPVLVINPLRDKMVRPETTRSAYERLGGPKAYAEIDAGHWSMLPEFSEAWADEADTWMKGLLR